MKEINKSKYLIATPHEYPDWMTGAYKEAKSFAGLGGHIAAISEIAKVRLFEDALSAPPWLLGLTGRNAMYFGLSSENKLTLIISKEKVGPLKGIAGISHTYYSPDSSCGIIKRNEFIELMKEKVEVIDLERYFNDSSRVKYFASTFPQDLYCDEIIFSLFGVYGKNYIEKVSRLIRQSVLRHSMAMMASTVIFRIFPKNFVDSLVAKRRVGFFNDSAIAVLPTLPSHVDQCQHGSIISFEEIRNFSFVGVKK